MLVSSALPRRASSPQQPAPQPPEKELEVNPDREHIADRYNFSRTTGNYVSGMAIGAAKETVTTAVQSPRLAWEITENLWQADTIGPNLKILGTLAAIPAAALSLPAGPLYGLFQGWSQVHNSGHQDGPLTKDTSAGFANQVMNVQEDGEARTMTGKLIDGLEELGSKPLAEGEKPYDVPILSPAFSLAGGVVSSVLAVGIGGVAGLVAGVVTMGKDIKDSVSKEGLSAGERIGKFCFSPLNLVAAPVLAWKSFKEAAPRGFVDGWNHGPFKPIIDTGKITATMGASVIKEAWER